MGALIASGQQDDAISKWLVLAALVLATINVVGGYCVTDRMLSMFKTKKDS